MRVYREGLREGDRGKTPAALATNTAHDENPESHDLGSVTAALRAQRVRFLTVTTRGPFFSTERHDVKNFDLFRHDVTPTKEQQQEQHPAPPKAPQEPALRAGELIYFDYIPRGKAEPEKYPGVVIFQHDGQVSFVLAELVDGAPRARQGRIELEKVFPRETPHDFDYVAQGLLMVIKNQKIRTKVVEAALSENRAKENLRREKDRQQQAAAMPGSVTPSHAARRRM
jgi:hypothetical protein